MGEFIIEGQDGYIHITSDKIVREEALKGSNLWLEFKGYIEIKCGNFKVEKCIIWFTFDEIYHLYVELERCYKELNGSLQFENFEHNIKIDIDFDKGKVSINGSYREGFASNNELIFSIASDQSYFEKTLNQIKESFIDKYVKQKK